MKPTTMTLLKSAAGATLLAGLSWAFGGLVGLLAAAVALAVNMVAGPRWVAGGAVGALVVAAVATAVPSDLLDPQFTSTYAARRPVAASAALVAGVLAFVAVAGFFAEERATQRTASPTRRLRRRRVGTGTDSDRRLP